MRILLNILAIVLACFMNLSVSAVEIVKHGRYSATQTLKPGDKLGSFFYTVYPKDAKIEVFNLAPGMKYSIDYDAYKDSAKVNIFGTATADYGRYKFRVEASKDGVSAKPRTGYITITADLIYALNPDELDQEIEEGDSINEVYLGFANGLVKIESSKMVDGVSLEMGEDIASAKLVGKPTKTGKSQVVLIAETNGLRDTLVFNLNVLKDGLWVKNGSGNSKQVVYIDEEIVPITINWECYGQLKVDYSTNGIDIDVDKENKQIKIYGAPRSLGNHTVSVEFITKHSVTSYKVNVIALEDTYPSFYVVSNNNTLDQVVPYRSKIEPIEIEVMDADSIAVKGLPDGIQSSFDEESGVLLISGYLREDAAFEVTVEAYNKAKKTDLKIYISSLKGSASSILAILSEKNIKVDRIDLINVSGSVVGSYSYDDFDINLLPKDAVNLLVFYTEKGVIVTKFVQ